MGLEPRLAPPTGQPSESERMGILRQRILARFWFTVHSIATLLTIFSKMSLSCCMMPAWLTMAQHWTLSNWLNSSTS